MGPTIEPVLEGSAHIEDPADPQDQPNPEGSPPLESVPEETLPPPYSELARALTLLANSIGALKVSKARTKVHEPDPFDGSDTRKLQPFLVQCQLNFRDRPDTFTSNEAKVTFALSYLKGTVLDYFEPALMDPDENPIWSTNYSKFTSELWTNFGPFNPKANAKNELDWLRMKDNQKITKYIVSFQQLALRVQWGQAALQQQFYIGLPSWIKDEIARIGKLDTLIKLRELSQGIDARYWEHHSEISRENALMSEAEKSSEKTNKLNNKSDKKSDNSSQKKTPGNSGSSSSGNTTNNSGSLNNSTNKKSTLDLLEKLGKDGKLTPQERQRRMDGNLCLFCGKGGHMVKDCTKATSSASKMKARGANATEDKSDVKATDSKNSKQSSHLHTGWGLRWNPPYD
jgi:Retrotransposon gag protein